MGSRWIDTLPEEAALALRAAMARQTFAKGQLVFAPKEAPRGLRLVEAGSAYLGLMAENGAKLTLGIVRPGGVIGHAGAFDRRATTVFVEARTALEVSFVSARALNELREIHPAIDRAMAELIVRDLRGLLNGVEELVLLPLHDRVVRCLRRLARELSPVSGERIVLDITQDELAAMTAASRPAVNAVLRKLERSGAVACGYRQLTCSAAFASRGPGV